MVQIQLRAGKRFQSPRGCDAFQDAIVHPPIDLLRVPPVRPHRPGPPSPADHQPTALRIYVLFFYVMAALDIEPDVPIWMVDDIPARMVYAGRRWRITDVPTRLRDSIWGAGGDRRPLYGWRFQATDTTGECFVFDVFPEESGWNVHRAYA